MSERYYLSDIAGEHLLTKDCMFCPTEEATEDRQDLLAMESPRDAGHACELLGHLGVHVKPRPRGSENHPSVIYRPEGPFYLRGPHEGERMGPDALDFAGMRFYIRVMVENEVVVAYCPFYFITINEIVADLLELTQGEDWLDRFCQFEDFVIWNGSKVLAVVHSLVDYDADPVENRVVLFNETGNQPRQDYPSALETLAKGIVIWDGWPSREEWIANGRGPLDWLDPHEHPERAHHKRLLEDFDGTKEETDR